MNEKLGDGSDFNQEQDSLSPSFSLKPALKSSSKILMSVSFKHSEEFTPKSNETVFVKITSVLMFIMNERK